MLLLSVLLIEKQIEYDKMLKSCNHISGRELEIKKLEMKELESEIIQIRQAVSFKVNNHVK